ncbi:MAG: CDP-glycerol glycerophosphotransferase family protein [Prevotella sp.]|nr:CDP-glycerol glycerophosphotransferase family protein [Prevotella sp.]
MSIKKLFQKYQRTNGGLKGICLFVYYFIHIGLEYIYILFVKFFIPVKESVIVFRSRPDYSDNARALADYMVDYGYTKKYRVFFDVVDVDINKGKKDSIFFVSTRAKHGIYKLRSIYLLFTAKYLMSTHEMIVFRKRLLQKKQMAVRLWHGCGYKDNYRIEHIRNFDVALVPGELFVKTKALFWNVDEKYILPIGYPRYDWLRMNDSTAQSMLMSFKKNQFTKVILWMPTFRVDKTGRYPQSNSMTRFPIVGNEQMDWEKLDDICRSNNIVLLIKLHPNQKQYDIPFCSFTNIIEIVNQFFDNIDLPHYKFVGLTDALISDYSSIAVDYLVVNRPIAFTLDDYEEYNNTRGFIFDDPRAYMPGHHLYTFKDLERFIIDVSNNRDPYKSQREQMYSKAICYSDNYCKSVLDTLGIYK